MLRTRSLKAPIAVHDLGSLQVEIMKVIWSRETSSVQDVMNAFPAHLNPAYVTVLTVMRRLEKRGFLTHEQVDRKFIYRATVGRDTVRLSLVRDLMSRFFSSPEELKQTIDRAVVPA